MSTKRPLATPAAKPDGITNAVWDGDPQARRAFAEGGWRAMERVLKAKEAARLELKAQGFSAPLAASKEAGAAGTSRGDTPAPKKQRKQPKQQQGLSVLQQWTPAEPKKKEEETLDAPAAEPLYEIESIEGTASDRTGHRCYIVKWRGYTETSLELVSRVHHVEAFAPALEAYRWKQRHDTDII